MCAPVEIALTPSLFSGRGAEKNGLVAGFVIPKLLRKPLEGEQASGMESII